jgi:Rhodanese-like domain
MATSVKQMLEAANAIVPKITAEQAADMIAKRNALVVDVRDALEVAASGKIAGAVNVPRGMLEFRADPESQYHDKNFEKGNCASPVGPFPLSRPQCSRCDPCYAACQVWNTNLISEIGSQISSRASGSDRMERFVQANFSAVRALTVIRNKR